MLFHPLTTKLMFSMLNNVMGEENLTQKQRKILKFIHQTIEEDNCPPTIREIGKRFAIKSTRGVVDHLKSLQKKGWIKRKRGKARGIELTQPKVDKLFVQTDKIPLVGKVAAGEPTLAVENIETVLGLEEMFPNRGDLFALKVKGESMKEAGIHKGDILIVRQQSTARVGDIVTAIINDQEGTVKKLAEKGAQIRLEPANPDYNPIIKPAQEVEIRGLVVGVVRKI